MLATAAATSPVDVPQGLPQTADSSAQLSEACALLALMVRSQSATQSSAKDDVEIDFKKMQALKQQLADAIQKAKDAADDSGFFGFLSSVFGDDVAQIAGAVAAIAAVVATGGAAAPLILMAVSVAMEEGAKVAAKLGVDPKICMAIGLASAAVGLCSGSGTIESVGIVATVGRDVEVGANLAHGGAAIAGGALGYVSGHYHAEQLSHQADATGYQAQNVATDLDFDAAIAQLQQALRAEQNETRTTSAIVQNNADTNSALCNRI
jgi:hypothetical protein